VTHEEFADKIRKAFGGKVPPDARQNFGNFLRNKDKIIWLNYDWIRHGGFYRWVLECPEIDFGEGSRGMSVWICNRNTL